MFGKRGMTIHVMCHGWSGKGKLEVGDLIGEENIVNKKLLTNPQFNLLDSKFKNKISSAQQGFRKFPLTLGYRLHGVRGAFFIPFDNLTKFDAEFTARKTKYTETIILPMKAEYIAARDAKIVEIRQQCETIKAENPSLPEDYVDKKVAETLASFPDVEDIAKVYDVEYLPDPHAHMIMLNPEDEEALAALDTLSQDFRTKLLDIAKSSADTIDKANGVAWKTEIIARLSKLKLSCETDPKLHGNTINAAKEFVPGHISKNYFSSNGDIADKLNGVLGYFNDPKNVNKEGLAIYLKELFAMCVAGEPKVAEAIAILNDEEGRSIEID